MASTINAITTGTGGVQTTADSSGIINLQSNGSNVLSAAASGVSIPGTLGVTGAMTASGGLAVTGTLTVNGASPGRAGSTTTVFSSSNLTLTLTSSSNQLQIIQGSAAGKIILPNATTMTKGTGYFTFYNSNPYPVAVADSTGTTREYLPVNATYSTTSLANTGAGSTLQLIDNSTAAGVWRLGNPIVAATYNNVAIFAGTWDTSKFQSNNYSELQILRVSDTTGIAIYQKASDLRYVYARALTFNTSTKAITYGATEQQVYFFNSTSPTRYVKWSAASDGINKGLIALGGFSTGVNGSSAWGNWIGFAIVSGDLYLSSLLGQTTTVASTGNWGTVPEAAIAQYSPQCYYAGSNGSFMTMQFGAGNPATGGYTTNYFYIKGVAVGVSGTTVSLTEATGNTLVSGAVGVYTHATSSFNVYTSGAYESANASDVYVSGSGKYWSYNTSTNTLTIGSRTANTTLRNLLPEVSSSFPYANAANIYQLPLGTLDNTLVWNFTNVYTVSGAGTAAVTGTANTYGLKYKNVEQSSYTLTSATSQMPISSFNTFYIASATDYRVISGNYLYTFNPSSATLDMNRAGILPSQTPVYIDSTNLLVYNQTYYEFTPIASPYIT
jgi:fibronectin-binding autotransporter adhesin